MLPCFLARFFASQTETEVMQVCAVIVSTSTPYSASGRMYKV